MGKYKFWCAGCYTLKPNEELGEKLKNVNLCKQCKEQGFRLKEHTVIDVVAGGK